MKRYFVVVRICVKGTYPPPKRRERRRSLVRECRTLDFREKGWSSNPSLRKMFSVEGNAWDLLQMNFTRLRFVIFVELRNDNPVIRKQTKRGEWMKWKCVEFWILSLWNLASESSEKYKIFGNDEEIYKREQKRKIAEKFFTEKIKIVSTRNAKAFPFLVVTRQSLRLEKNIGEWR